jgi:alpha,alpha-trehalase
MLSSYLNLPKQLLKIIAQQKEVQSGYKPLELYGIIGNLETCALVAADGSIDWLCLPHLENPSVFAYLLDKEKGGFFSIQPKKTFQGNQKYFGHTNVLKTYFETETGTAVITDFMPLFKKRAQWHKQQTLFRKVECTKGVVSFTATFTPRFQYAKLKPKFSATEGGVVATTDSEKLFLDATVALEIQKDQVLSHFTLSAGEKVYFSLQYNSRTAYTPQAAEKELKKTVTYWENWAHKCQIETCVFRGPWHEHVVRSELVLKLLTHGETGSIAAAATTSLPEVIGGVRNWDYRFNWIRDSVLTAQALYNSGHAKEAKELFNWYKKLYKGVKVADIQIMHGLHGENQIPEITLRHLTGYKNSRPVRIGNLAAVQKQLDIYGELLNMAFEVSRYGESVNKNDWKLLRKVVNHVCDSWNLKDAGLWEMRGAYRHFVYSKVMCWVAVDRGIKIAEKKQFEAPLDAWKKIRDDISRVILNKGFNKNLNSFVQSFGSNELDASNLLIPAMGFLPYTDPRVQGTINATIKYLSKNGFLYRYTRSDRLPGQEGAFVFCTNWLVDTLALSGRITEAETLYKNLLKNCGPLLLYAEEIEPNKKFQMGNFPQAFSHVGIINSALYLGLAKGQQTPKTKPLSSIKVITSKLFKNLTDSIKIFNS